MATAEVHTDPTTLERNDSRSVIGELWLALDSASFPAEGYTDFVVVVLSWLVAALWDVRRGPETVHVDFMDDPYAVELSALPNGLVRLRAIAGDDELRASVDADLDQFTESVLASADAVLAECARRGWWDRDCENLRLWAGALRLTDSDST